ncbi:unnamed protein product [Lathyrus sativus]|nr:unnamed protein product [Lathyrus sativus]
MLSRWIYPSLAVDDSEYLFTIFNNIDGGELIPLWEGDVDAGDLDGVFDQWCGKVVGLLKGDGDVVVGDLENGDVEYGVLSSDEEESDEEEAESAIVDLEDIAGKAPSRMSVATVKETNGNLNGKKEMVTPVIRENLVKQGYNIIGSHSGVKICRWTKSQLRGRGGCYKHSFYGIESHRCMEATPSLACANKCVGLNLGIF